MKSLDGAGGIEKASRIPEGCFAAALHLLGVTSSGLYDIAWKEEGARFFLCAMERWCIVHLVKLWKQTRTTHTLYVRGLISNGLRKDKKRKGNLHIFFLFQNTGSNPASSHCLFLSTSLAFLSKAPVYPLSTTNFHRHHK